MVCNYKCTYSPLADIESLLHRQFASRFLPIIMGGSIVDYPGFLPLRRNPYGRANGAAISFFFTVAAHFTARSGAYIGTWQATIQNVRKPSTKGERGSGDYSTTLLDLRQDRFASCHIHWDILLGLNHHTYSLTKVQQATSKLSFSGIQLYIHENTCMRLAQRKGVCISCAIGRTGFRQGRIDHKRKRACSLSIHNVNRKIHMQLLYFQILLCNRICERTQLCDLCEILQTMPERLSVQSKQELKNGGADRPVLHSCRLLKVVWVRGHAHQYLISFNGCIYGQLAALP